jgi:hypothetical protein
MPKNAGGCAATYAYVHTRLLFMSYRVDKFDVRDRRKSPRGRTFSQKRNGTLLASVARVFITHRIYPIRQTRDEMLIILQAFADNDPM